ncbi:MAG: HAD family hydrolase [Chthoniobacterales bacterium]
MSEKTPVVFFDRDGTLMEEVHYCNDPADVRVIAGAAEGLRALREAGWARVIITNQSGIPRGRISLVQYEAVHDELVRQLGGEIDGTYFSPDLPDSGSRRRKPGIGMVEEAVRDLGLDRKRAYFVGDKAVDVECGHAAGMPSILVRTGQGRNVEAGGADYVAADVGEAIEWILRREGTKGVPSENRVSP